MIFDWDIRKAKENLKKHKISFEEAITVFYDPFAKISDDPDHSLLEERFILIGFSRMGQLLLVIHVYREKSEIIRIISARKATKSEKKYFEEI